MTESGKHYVNKEPFRIGISYWPRRSGIELWKHFDVDEVHEDFSILSEIGVNLARIALVWEDFQPEPDSLRCSALAHLLELCDAAASEGVRLELLLFAGPIDHPERFPKWLLDKDPDPHCDADSTRCRLVNPFSNALAKSAATTLVGGIARMVGGHPAIWSYNLGDRPDRLAPHCCRLAANAWFEDLRQAIHAVDPKHPVTCSLGPTNLSTNDTLRVDEVFSHLDHSTIDGDGIRIGAGSAEALGIFSCALTTALSGKPCVLQAKWEPSAGLPASTNSEAEQALASSARSLLEGLHGIGALGAVVGSFAEPVDARQAGPTTGGLGLLETDGHLTPYADTVLDFTSRKRVVQRVGLPTLNLGVSADEYYRQPEFHIRRLFGEFLAS